MPSIYEKKWPSVILTPITIANSVITVSSTSGLHPKQLVSLIKPGVESQRFEIKRVICPNSLYIGPVGAPITVYLNPTEFDGGTLCAEEQNRNAMDSNIVIRACYAEEPTVALRTATVDECGEYIDSVVDSGGIRRLAVDAAVNISHLEVNVDNPNAFQVHNIAVPLAGVEQVFVMPNNIAGFMIRVRDAASVLNLAYAPGGSSTNFIKVYRGTNFNSGHIDSPTDLPVPGLPLTIYYQVDKPGVIVELLLWLRI